MPDPRSTGNSLTPPGTTLVGNPAVAQRLLDVNIRLRARSVDDFLVRYSPFVDDDRIFIFTRAAPPVGTRLRFALHLAQGELLLRGRGIVRRVNVDGERPGMELLFAPVDEPSALLLERVRRRRRSEMTPPDGSPASASSPVLPSLPATSLSWPLVRTPAPVGKNEFERDVNLDVPTPLLPAGTMPLETMAEAPRFREDVAATVPDLDPEGDAILANPLGGMSDGAIDYFVQWSLGEHDEDMPPPASMPEMTPPLPRALPSPAPSPVRRPYRLLALAFVAGAALATAATWLLTRALAPPAPATASAPPAAAPSATAPSPTTAPPSTVTPETVTPEIVTPPTVAPNAAPVGAAPAATAPLHDPPLATLSIASPAHAAVAIDGEPRGRTPLTLRLPRYQRYQLEVTTASPAGHWRREVYLRDARTQVRFPR